MSFVRWTALFLIAGLLNAVLYFSVPLVNVLFLETPKREKAVIQTVPEFIMDVKHKPQEQEKKTIRKMERPAQAFKPAQISGRAQGFQMDLSLAGGDGSGVGVSTGTGDGSFGALGNGLGAEVYDPSEVDQEARVLRDAQPDFPMRARKEGVNGHVKLYLVIDSHGQVTDVQVLSVDPVGYGFEIEAQKAIRQFKFEPAKLKDVPVAQKATKEFVFDLGY